MTGQDRHVADDLDRAWADAVALSGQDDAGPAPSVRANVLAAAHAVAAQQAGPSAAVDRVDQARAGAANRPAWRLRAGAGLFAALVVGVLAWRGVDHGRDPGTTAVAAAAPDEAAANVARAPAPPVVADVAPPAPRQPARALTPVIQPLARVPAPRAAKARADADVEARTVAPPVTLAMAAPPPQDVGVLLDPDRPASSLRRLATPAPAPAPMMGAIRPNQSSSAARAPTLAGVASEPADTLHAAASRGDGAAIVRLLAVPGAQVDAPDASGRTALLHAVLARQPGAVRALLAAGADPARADATGLSPRAAAQASPDAEIAALLAAPR